VANQQHGPVAQLSHPSASAGPDLVVKAAAGSRSTPPARSSWLGDIKSFEWRQLEGPSVVIAQAEDSPPEL
jgi:hypothetical protein